MPGSFTEQRRGNLRIFTGANPGAGNIFTVTPPVATVSILKLFTCRLSTDANVASRIAEVQAFDGTSVYQSSFASLLLNAGNFMDMTWSPGVTAVDHFTAANILQSALATDFIIQPGDDLRLDVTNIQVGDTITAITFTLEEFFI